MDLDIVLAGTRYNDLASLSKHIEKHHHELYSIFQQHCGALFYSGFEISLLVHSIGTVMDTGATRTYDELSSTMRPGDNVYGNQFLTGLKILWDKAKLESQKRNANLANLRVPRLAAVCLQLGRYKSRL
jgi:hypothetical protein